MINFPFLKKFDNLLVPTYTGHMPERKPYQPPKLQQDPVGTGMTTAEFLRSHFTDEERLRMAYKDTENVKSNLRQVFRDPEKPAKEISDEDLLIISYRDWDKDDYR